MKLKAEISGQVFPTPTQEGWSLAIQFTKGGVIFTSNHLSEGEALKELASLREGEPPLPPHHPLFEAPDPFFEQ